MVSIISCFPLQDQNKHFTGLHIVTCFWSFSLYSAFAYAFFFTAYRLLTFCLFCSFSMLHVLYLSESFCYVFAYGK